MRKVISVKPKDYAKNRRFVAIYPWMLKLGITDVKDLYVFADLDNLSNYYGEIKYNCEDDIRSLADYISLSATDFNNSVQNLYNMGLIEPVIIEDENGGFYYQTLEICDYEVARRSK